MNSTPTLVIVGEPPALRITAIDIPDEANPSTMLFSFNRPMTDSELARTTFLPPSVKVAEDLADMVGKAMLMEIALRALRTFVINGVLTTETEGVKRWALDWIDGHNHGPVGQGPMLWPIRLPKLRAALDEWGFGPTDTKPQLVGRKRPIPN